MIPVEETGAEHTEELRFRIEFQTKLPIEVLDLTSSLTALVRQYQKHAVGFDDVSSRKEAKLYVSDLRKGSIIADLVPYAIPYAQEVGAAVKAVAPFTEDAKKVIGFAKYLKTGMDFMLAGKKAPDDVSAKDLKDFNQILEPVAKEPGAKFLFQARDGATQNITINYNSQETNAIQNQSLKQIEIMKEPEQRLFEKRLMYWHAATKGKSSKTNDKVIIESIDPKPLPVYIEDPKIKKKMMAGRKNPFLVGFIVDVELLIVRGKVRGCSVLALHETLEDDDNSSDKN